MQKQELAEAVQSIADALHAEPTEAKRDELLAQYPALERIVRMFYRQACEPRATALSAKPAPQKQKQLSTAMASEAKEIEIGFWQSCWPAFTEAMAVFASTLSSAKKADAVGSKRFKSDGRYAVHYQYWLWQAGLFASKPTDVALRAFFKPDDAD